MIRKFILDYGRLLCQVRVPSKEEVEATILATNEPDEFYPVPFGAGIPIVEAMHGPADNEERGIVWHEVIKESWQVG